MLCWYVDMLLICWDMLICYLNISLIYYLNISLTCYLNISLIWYVMICCNFPASGFKRNNLIIYEISPFLYSTNCVMLICNLLIASWLTDLHRFLVTINLVSWSYIRHPCLSPPGASCGKMTIDYHKKASFGKIWEFNPAWTDSFAFTARLTCMLDT